MPDHLPGIRSTDESEASTLIVTMSDIGSGLEVDLIYVVLHEYDAVMRRAVFRNVDNDNYSRMGDRIGKVVQKACSFTIDFELGADPFHMLQLSGSWGRERYMVETKLSHGMQSFGSMRGVSGHQHNPFAVVTVGPPSETQGEVKGFSLIYSGNFLFEAELGEMGRLRVNMGIHPMGLQWYLKPGGVFNTPEAVLVRSNKGLGGMSRVLHRLFLDKLIPHTWADDGPTPVLLNTWEARYFNVNHDNVVEMAKQAARVGIDLIVLDDGWFGKRNDITTSLGDWTADLTKFPLGLNGLADAVNAAGCKFGLWIEPEMVSEDSSLHSMHPDWYLRVPGRPRQIGRNQFVLDLSRKEVRDYLFEAIRIILSNANIEYVKWDMNRPLTEIYSQRVNDQMIGTSVWQSETSHRYVLGLYELQGRITKAFPNVLLENCSSGGGRFDPGMLYFSPQIWCSDNTDALVRMKIQYGTSLAYPARCVGAHLSCVPNHITGNTTRLRTRGFVAMSGTFGFELDLCAASAIEKLQYKELVACYRTFSSTIRFGDLYRLWNPFNNTFAAWMYVTRDKRDAVVFAFSLNSDHWSNLVPR
jgi:alpha-galactosidase